LPEERVFQSTRPVRGATYGKGRADCAGLRFQSTRPVRGATLSVSDFPLPCCCFNPRAPCGARHPIAVHFLTNSGFQSTRPVRGATPIQFRLNQIEEQFQSTRPVRGATGIVCRTTGRR